MTGYLVKRYSIRLAVNHKTFHCNQLRQCLHVEPCGVQKGCLGDLNDDEAKVIQAFFRRKCRGGVVCLMTQRILRRF